MHYNLVNKIFCGTHFVSWEPGEGAAAEDDVPKKPLQFSAINSDF